MTELGIFACVVATMFGFVRVFDDHGYLGRLVIVAALASLCAAFLRRRGVGIVWSTIIHLATGLIIVSNLYLPGTSTAGLPTGATFTVARTAISDEVSQLRFAVPPVATTTGLLVLLAILTWTLTFFADSAAMRAHAPVQALAPLLVTFMAVGVSQPGFERVRSIVVLGVAVGLYTLAVRHSRDLDLRWADPPGGRRSGLIRLTLSRAAMSIVVLAALALVATIPPGKDPVVSLRNHSNPKGREVVSPFVSIRALLGTRSDVPMFRAETDTASYWRLTALDTYEPGRDIWISTGTYRKTRDPLPGTTAGDVGTITVDQRFEMLGIGGPWMPMVFEARRYRGGPAATFNDATSTLFADEDLTDGQSYEVSSAVPRFDVADLVRAGIPGFDEYDENLLRVPIETEVERSFLDSVTEGSSGPYHALLALQDTFRTEFAYSEEADYSASDDPVSEFLVDRTGFCQQFSSVFAILARRMGLPSRVAVGFTMGDQVEQDAITNPSAAGDEGSDRTFLVRGRHAHAWPEVYFAGLGWVAFEPTPGRGNPATTSYTGVAAAQAAPEPDPEDLDTPATTPSLPSSDPEESATTVPTDTTPDPIEERSTTADTDPSEDDGRQRSLMLVLAIAAAALFGSIAWVRGRRRGSAEHDTMTGPAVDPDSRLLVDAWESALRSIAELDLHPLAAETPLQFCHRVARHLGAYEEMGSEPVSNLVVHLGELAEIETVRRYSPLFDDPGPVEREAIGRLVVDADSASAAVTSAVAAMTAEHERVPS